MVVAVGHDVRPRHACEGPGRLAAPGASALDVSAPAAEALPLFLDGAPDLSRDYRRRGPTLVHRYLRAHAGFCRVFPLGTQCRPVRDAIRSPEANLVLWPDRPRGVVARLVAGCPGLALSPFAR